VNFKSFEAFLSEYCNVVQNLSANKLKRLSKTYLIFLRNYKTYLFMLNFAEIVFLVFRAFTEEYKKPFSPTSKDDRDNFLALKRNIFESLKIDQEILSDSYLAE
jgi:hypothetical protein